MMNILKKVQRMVRMALHGRDMVKKKIKQNYVYPYIIMPLNG